MELPCPESCSYLLEARASASHREKELRVKETPDPRTLILGERALIALDAIERAIVHAQRGIGPVSFHDLSDADILTAIENSTKNLETEESGLIYEHRSSAPKIDQLSRRVRDAIEEMSKETPPEARPRRSDIIRALNSTHESVAAHMKRDAAGTGSARSFIRYISLFYPWPEEASRPLIV